MESRGQRLLQDARNLVAESWCHGADARDVGGFEVDPWDDDAASWSLLGAVVAVLEREASLAGELPLDELVVAVLDQAAAAYEDNCALLELSLN